MPRSRTVLIAFLVVTAANLLANATGGGLAFLLTKPLLMPLLAAYLWRVSAERAARPDRLLLAALAFATGGDVALMIDGPGWFLAGMACFLGTHLCYLAAFTRHGAATALRRTPLVAVPLGYAVLTVVALTWMWAGLTDVGLALPVAGYAIALAAMASTAATQGWRVGLGAALFLGSDLLIAAGVAEVAQPTGAPVLVMATYAAGQALIVTGLAARAGTPTDAPVTPATAPATP
ncbi:lysoplasmalogenase [Micromonospora sp. NPDC048843]|uniref:lysoplasmalogenase n=1 Tax=Micromonospora sp. NPDC048843 TaxID=3155389 RepID=UPI0034000F37